MTVTQMAKGALDKVLEKVVSRKLLVWGTATALLFTSNLESEHWLYLSALYIVVQSIIDAIVKFKSA